jgi:hypothetical protein
MKIQFKVINLGLNEFGVQELNNYYKDNISMSWVHKFKLGEIVGGNTKIFKQEKLFLKLKENNYIGNYNCTQYIKGSEYGGGYFSIQLKHINYRIVKLEIIEKENEFVF